MQNQQKSVFMEIRNEREHICDICWSYIYEPKTYTFAHILNKGMYSTYKFDKNNISIVCSIDCHEEVDRRRVWLDSEIRLLLSLWESPLCLIKSCN